MFISIGGACNVKYQIDKYNNKCETLFFDWLLTDMNSVIDILSCIDIKKILNKNNLKIEKGQNNSQIIIKSLSHCVSIHDLAKDFNDNDIKNFIQKYERRFNRIIENIKSLKTIYFIRFGKILLEEKNNFIKTILNINPNSNFYLVVINNSEEKEIINKEKYYIEVLINIKYDSNDWTTSYINSVSYTHLTLPTNVP
jgi:hypothetical protein